MAMSFDKHWAAITIAANGIGLVVQLHGTKIHRDLRLAAAPLRKAIDTREALRLRTRARNMIKALRPDHMLKVLCHSLRAAKWCRSTGIPYETPDLLAVHRVVAWKAGSGQRSCEQGAATTGLGRR